MKTANAAMLASKRAAESQLPSNSKSLTNAITPPPVISLVSDTPKKYPLKKDETLPYSMCFPSREKTVSPHIPIGWHR